MVVTGIFCDGVGLKSPSKSAAIHMLSTDPMSIWNQYHLAHTILDALSVLQDSPNSARLIAGGTDLLLDIQQGRHSPVDILVDITHIPELNCLEIRQDSLFVGAAVPLNRIAASPLVRQHAEALVEACSLIGGPQVRNTATLGGNVAHALPAGDGTIALVALDAQVEIAGPGGLRRAPILDLFQGPGINTLDPRLEMLVGFYLPKSGPNQGSAFARVMRPQGVAIAILNLCGWVHRDGERIADVRISIGPAGPTPQRSPGAEEILRGKIFSSQILHEAANGLLAGARLRTSPHRSTAEYRKHVSEVLLAEVVEKAWERAGRKNE